MTADAHRFDPSILRSYDIRGIIGETLSDTDAFALGLAFADMLAAAGQSKVAVGRDGRLSSPSLSGALIEGLMAGGTQVTAIGLGPTPMVYYAVHAMDHDAGIAVTGSHNPPHHNGFKMLTRAAPIYGDAIRDLGDRAAMGCPRRPGGTVTEIDVRTDYVKRLLEAAPKGNPGLVVWDAGNGAVGEVLGMLVAQLPGRHRVLFGEIDGSFPNHHPDPTVEANLVDLRTAVASSAASLGIAFDGDGDRVGVIDGQGRVLWGDQLLALLARPVLKERPGATVIADVKAGSVVFEEVSRLGGTPVMWKTGHSLIKAKMKETGAPLAGEMSGHLFFADHFYGVDDALYAALRILSVMVEDGRPLAELAAELPPAEVTPELRIEVPEERKFAIMEAIAEHLGARDDLALNTVDGVRADTADGWFLIRASNTQAALVARAEARDVEGLERLKQEIRDQLSREGVDASTV